MSMQERSSETYDRCVVFVCWLFTFSLTIFALVSIMSPKVYMTSLSIKLLWATVIELTKLPIS